MVAAYTAAGVWGDETIYRLAAQQAPMPIGMTCLQSWKAATSCAGCIGWARPMK